jgi:ABC-type Na+ efflux pump permease subunit
MNLKDTAERLVWTLLAAFLGALGVSGVTDITTLQAGLTAAASAGVNFLLLVARARLAVLPSPGEGLPGLPTDDEGQSNVMILVALLVGFALGALCYANGIFVD